MLLLLIAVYACIELREIYPKGSDPREALKTWHFMLGLSVFVLVWLRLLVNITSPDPSYYAKPAKVANAICQVYACGALCADDSYAAYLAGFY